MRKYPSIVFIGTPYFAVYSIEKLLQEKYSIIAIVTAPDKKAGRGQKISESAVKKYALIHKIPVLQPEYMKDPFFLEILRKLKPQIIIVVAFRMIPKVIWSIPELGTFNLHPSLLPNYRGPAPIQWVIINGEKETGVTTFLLDEKIDSGSILLQRNISIDPQENAGSLYKRLAQIGANLVVETLSRVLKKDLNPQNQIVKNNLKIAPKLFHKDMKIHWHSSMEMIFNKIRGLSPYPGAWTYLIDDLGKKLKFKIYRANCSYCLHSLPIGTLILNKNEMKIALAEGYLSIIEGQLEGRRRMQSHNLFNGLQRKNYSILDTV